jgi:hypothetical protein
MNLKFSTIILFLFPIFIYAQNFSGEIEFQISFIAKNDKVNIDSIKSANYGDRAIYLIQDGYYKNMLYKNDKLKYSYTYDNVSKRMYDEEVDRNFITFRDSRKGYDAPFKSQIYKDSTLTILGKSCFLVTYQDENSFTKSYYSKKVKVDHNLFANHNVGNWYNKLKEVDGSIGLKTITEYEDHIVIYEAVNIKKSKVKQTAFDLPKEKMIVASYYALDKNVELSNPNEEQLNCYFDKIKKAKSESSTTEPFTSIISFVLTENGELKHIEPIEKDEYGFYKVALDIIENCQLKFIPGQINKQPVSSFTFLPITFE